MTVDALVTSIVTSGIVSASFGLYAHARVKKLELQYNHKKFILAKRTYVYELIGDFISSMESEFYRKDGQETTQKDIDAITERLKTILGCSVWISKDCYEPLLTLNYYLLMLNAEKDTKKVQRNRKEIVNAFHMLLPGYFEDLVSLDNIKAFSSEKIKSLLHDKRLFGGLPPNAEDPVRLDDGREVIIDY